MLQPVVDHVVTAVAGVRWSVCVRDGRDPDGTVLASHAADAVRSTASVGKLLLLLEVARRLADGRLQPAAPLRRRRDLAVADSGLWQHLSVEALPVADLAVLVAAVSDNLATNVLLDAVGGPAALREVTAVAGGGARLLDRVRDVRGPADPPRLSEGSATAWSLLVHRAATDDLPWPGVAARLRRWLSTAVDTSMVASALHLDPLAHAVDDGGGTGAGPRWWGKTGTDVDVRADVGHLAGPSGRLTYAVLAEGDLDGARRGEVLTGMRALGRALHRHVTG